MSTAPLPVPMHRRLVAEFLGTALLVTVVVGSGIAAQQLSVADDVVVPHAIPTPGSTPGPAEPSQSAETRSPR